jgi:hypothetical protein
MALREVVPHDPWLLMPDKRPLREGRALSTECANCSKLCATPLTARAPSPHLTLRTKCFVSSDSTRRFARVTESIQAYEEGSTFGVRVDFARNVLASVERSPFRVMNIALTWMSNAADKSFLNSSDLGKVLLSLIKRDAIGTHWLVHCLKVNQIIFPGTNRANFLLSIELGEDLITARGHECGKRSIVANAIVNG